MRKYLSTIIVVLLALFIAGHGQQAPPRRTVQPSPKLATLLDSDDAAGIAQAPNLDVIVLSGRPIPSGSTVGIYGSHLVKNNVTKLWLATDGVAQSVDAEAYSMRLPNLEIVVFRLPGNVRGEVWVTAAGRQISNPVRIIVE